MYVKKFYKIGVQSTKNINICVSKKIIRYTNTGRPFCSAWKASDEFLLLFLVHVLFEGSIRLQYYRHLLTPPPGPRNQALSPA
jgi:hypothetical protein